MTDDADGPSDPSGRQEGPRRPGPGDDAPPAGKAGGPDLVGEVVAGRYRVLSRLGEGAMGAVYLAEHLRMGRRDALKVLSRSLADDDDARARFTREARNASFINHPNACTVYDFGEIADGLPFIAMEYVDGETLGDLLSREGRLSPDRAANLVAQVTLALEAAHARGIAHRDLKPDNIMLTRAPDGSERAKVVDFGIAKAMEDEGGQNLTMPGWVVGTPEYVSPEQLAGQDLDGRSDLYSLGIVLFRMLTGGLPFHGDTWQEVMTNRLSEPPDRLADVGGSPFPSALEDVVRRALEREPEDRYPDAAAFREALLRAVDAADQGPAAAKGGEPDEGARSVPRTSEVEGAADGGAEAASTLWSRFDRTQALAGGGLLVAAAAVVAWLVVGSGGEDASRTLGRQLDRLEGDPSEATLRAVDDTARIYWNMDGLGSEDRGLAAHVLGASLVAAGDTAAGLAWLERATNLVPAEDRYRNVLEEVRIGDVTQLLERQVARLDGSPGESGIRSAED
ncbi:MAG: serine/threonine-protein kinase, partial [Gemmatimonadota bacterium]